MVSLSKNMDYQAVALFTARYNIFLRKSFKSDNTQKILLVYVLSSFAYLFDFFSVGPELSKLLNSCDLD